MGQLACLLLNATKRPLTRLLPISIIMAGDSAEQQVRDFREPTMLDRIFGSARAIDETVSVYTRVVLY